ncbi:hypothetical protein [Oceanobacillus sp. Castelsardo]|uniref:hypothetical protein n=1 Tax=Oceanobacillus sp. Castelsardo TaxID=1851204 RepID=UPI0008399368|nr:hypothetical protein [Oceanobacillus sp. Castelsardo]
MELQKISLMDAYMIETLRSKGVTNQELVEQKDIEVWNDLHDTFDFGDLISLRKKDPDAFQTIVNDGYQVKFVTFNGLKNLLKLKFNRIEGIDYQTVEKGIKGLDLDTEERDQIKKLLSKNWAVKEEAVDEKTVLHIELI